VVEFKAGLGKRGFWLGSRSVKFEFCINSEIEMWHS
jgi:hypothetical protein